MYARAQAANCMFVWAAILLLFLFCVVAMLQSRLTRAAGHWLQHRTPMIEPRNSRLLSRTSTSAAELYYLRHTRSCAAAATGNKGGHPQQSTALDISGADFIARLLHSIWRDCYITVSIPLARLLQSIWQTGEYYTETAIKLMILFRAMLQSSLEIAREVTLTWLTPLELAACLHLASACIHQEFHTHRCEPNHCWVRASTRPSVQEMSAVAIALATLLLA